MILGAINGYLRSKAIIRLSQHGFMKKKPCLSNLISFNDKVTSLVDEGKAMDVIILDVIKT